MKLEQYFDKVMRELAIFQHYYQLNTEQALNLPLWEWNSLLEQREKLEAEKQLDNLRINAASFSGGEFYQTIEKMLIAKAYPEIKSNNQQMPTPDFFGVEIPSL